MVLSIERAKVPSFEDDWSFMPKGSISRMVRHPLSPFKRRALFSIVILAIVMAIGTIGMMVLEGWDLVTSFYFMSLLATAEGPAQAPATVGGKIFASFMLETWTRRSNYTATRLDSNSKNTHLNGASSRQSWVS